MKTRIIFLLLIVCPLFIRAQVIYTGFVKSKDSKPISSASIILKNNDGSIISYTTTTQNGSFKLSGNSIEKGRILEVNMLGFKKSTTQILESITNYNIYIEESAINIQDVVIRNKPIVKFNRDTLTYRAADFANKQDRVIGDVLKNMPGIEVAENGKISYNGKNISNFYIDGDNLLDDKYNIATRSIPKDAVEFIQVIEKDQPIKMLRGKTHSDNVAINITISDKAKLKPVGSISLGGGIPDRFDENGSIMFFGKKYKGINYLKTNNIGIDPSQDLTAHNLNDYLNRIENNKPFPLLSVGSVGNPDIPQKRHLFNRAGLINVNNLFNLKNDLQLKTNAWYMTDKQSKNYAKTNSIYLPENTFHFIEDQQNITKPIQFRTQITLNLNKDKNYFNNIFITDFNPIQQKNTMIANGVFLNQELQNKNFDISNELNLLSTLKSGKIINFYAYINRVNQPENLSISPGILIPQLNNNIPYSAAFQHVNVPTWFTNNYASMRFQSGKISQTYKAGFKLNQQQMQTELMLRQQNEMLTSPQINTANDLNWLKFTAYTEGIFEYKSQKLTSTLYLPFNHQRFYYNDEYHNYKGNLVRNFLNPRIALRYDTGTEHFVNFSYGLENTIGNINDIYKGIILTNYRNLIANNTVLPEQQTNSAILNFNYKKAITLFFFNIQAVYTNTYSNTIAAATISNNLQQRILLPLENNTYNYSLGINTSKYWFPLRTILTGSVSITKNNSNQLQNHTLFPIQNIITNYKAGLTTKITPHINFNYNSNYIDSKTKTEKEINTPKFEQLKQEFSATSTFMNNVFLTLSANHINTRQSKQISLNYFFADVNTRVKINKLKTDFELAVTNITNIKRYEAIYLSANSYTSTAYTIPGRIIMLKATFSY